MLKFLVYLFFVSGVLYSSQINASPLVADLSDTKIDITTDFSGTRLLLFGSINGPGDIVVVVRGPDIREVVRKKRRVGGIWVNGPARIFENAPGFYYLASSRTLKDVASVQTLRDHLIGYDSFELLHSGDYRDALIRLRESQALYVNQQSVVKLINDRLFRVDLSFPSSVPTGPYRAVVHLFRDGNHISSYAKQLHVTKVGVEAAVFNFAHTNSVVYGIIAVVIALLAGWLAGVVFRRS